MPNRAAVITALALVPALAHADTTITSADTLVVVTPNAPVMVQGSAAPGAQVQQLGAAEMPPVPAAPAAPQNESWSNVSHINGQIVPVGQRNDYLYQFKKTNISTNPIGMMFGYYGASLSIALSQNVALRVDANIWSTENGMRTGHELGISAPIYFRRTYSGPFFEPGLIVHGDSDNYDYAEYGAPCGGCSSTTDTEWAGPEMMFGWQWMFDSGLNVSAAFGAAKKMSGDTGSSDEPAPVGYFRLGYAF